MVQRFDMDEAEAALFRQEVRADRTVAPAFAKYELDPGMRGLIMDRDLRA